jgi:hypothetical protein
MNAGPFTTDEKKRRERKAPIKYSKIFFQIQVNGYLREQKAKPKLIYWLIAVVCGAARCASQELDRGAEAVSSLCVAGT